MSDGAYPAYGDETEGERGKQRERGQGGRGQAQSLSALHLFDPGPFPLGFPEDLPLGAEGGIGSGVVAGLAGPRVGNPRTLG
jgi:hypothetical protein